MRTETMTLDQFIIRYGLAMTARDAGPAGAGWTAEHRRYACTIRGAGSAPMRVHYHMNPHASGQALPTLADVLNSLALDASCWENAPTWEEWLHEWGVEEDVKKQRRAFNGCQKEARQLRELLGDDAYQALLWSTERL